MTNEGHLKELGISIRKRSSIFISLVFVNIVRNMGYNFVTIGLPDFIKSLEGSLALYGLAIGILQITQTIFQIPMAYISDKIGRRNAIAVGYSIHILGTILCGFSNTIWQIILFRAIQGIGVYASIIFATLSDLYDETERAKRFSLYTISLTIGYILGNFVGGLISDYIPLEYLFFISAGMNLLGFIFLILIVPETNPKKLGIEKSTQTKPNELITEKEQPYGLPFVFGLIMHGVKNFFFSGFLVLQIWNYQELFTLTGTQTGLILLPLTLFYILGLIVAPILRKRTKYFTYMMITSMVLAILILFTSGTASSLWMYIVTNLGLALTLAMQDPITTSYVTNHMDEKKLGLGSGILSTVGIFFSALGQISMPALAELLGFKWLHLTSGFFWLLLVGIVLFVNHQINQKEKRNHLSH